MARALVRGPSLRGFAAVLALLACAPRAFAGQEVLRDEWSITSMGGARIGHEHVVVRRLADPARIETRSEARTAFERLGQKVETTTDTTTVELEDGTLVS